MAFVDEGVRIDADFDCGSAGEIRVVDDCYEIEPKPEPVPKWFAAALEEHFAGAGVPREYACRVRISSLADEHRWRTSSGNARCVSTLAKPMADQLLNKTACFSSSKTPSLV